MDENSTSLPYEEIQPIQGAILGIIATPGVIGNIFAIFATIRILREQKLSPNIFVLSLAAIDLFGIVVVCIPTWLCYAFGGWIGGDKLCDFQGFMTLFCSLGSGGIATCMAVDRYLAVKAPFWHRRTFTARLATRVVFGVYFTSALISILPVVGFGSFVLNLTSTYCTLNWFATEIKDIVFSYLFATIGVTLVCTVIFCNINVIVRLFQRKEKTRALSAQSERDEQQKAKTLEKQFSRMMIVISTIFLICWVPFMNFPFLLPSNGSASRPRSTQHVTTNQTQLQTQTDSTRSTENENQLFISEKTQMDNFFQMAFERKEHFSSNSLCSAALALKQMAEESKKQVSHENALSFCPPSRGMYPSPPHPESSSSLSYYEKTLSPSDCFLSSNLISNVVGINDENVDSDEYQTGDGSFQALPYTCNCHSLPLRHLEGREESAKALNLLSC